MNDQWKLQVWDQVWKNALPSRTMKVVLALLFHRDKYTEVHFGDGGIVDFASMKLFQEPHFGGQELRLVRLCGQEQVNTHTHVYADALTRTHVQYPSFRGGKYPIPWELGIDMYSVQLGLGEGEPTESAWALSEEEQSQVGLRHGYTCSCDALYA